MLDKDRTLRMLEDLKSKAQRLVSETERSDDESAME